MPFVGSVLLGSPPALRAFNGIRPSIFTENSHVFQGICPVGVIRLLRDLSYFGNRFIEKQKSRHFCNFFAIRDSFLFP